MRRFGIRGWAVATATAVAVGLLPMTSVAVAADPEASGTVLPRLKQPAPVAVKPLEAGGSKRRDAAAANAWRGAPKANWPTPGAESLSLPESKTPAPARAKKLPVALANVYEKKTPAGTPVSKASVRVADRAAARKAGVEGLLVAVGRADGRPQTGQARVSIDYSGFRHAYGGDWAARLRLVQLPACALTTPEKPACRASKPLATINDTKTGTLTAVTSLGADANSADSTASSFTVLAATAGTAGSTGSFSATSLEASGAWGAGGAMGAFTWNYPISTPNVPGGLTPSVALGYNSQAVDGLTASTNNQGSWIGDGWSYEPGYIERRYKPCNDDMTGGTNTTKVGDLCWYNDNATLSLGGKTTEIVFDSTEGWHPANDAGEKIQKLTGASNDDSGTAGVDGIGEYWKVTTTDGTQYFFGRHKLPGWSDNGTAADDPLTQSAWNVPVYGNHAGEPCYNASFAAAACLQTWRWNLDYVVDARGNAMAYFWKNDTNYFGSNVTATGTSTTKGYHRGGWLDRIEYGLDGTAPYDTKAMGKVLFGVGERCLTNCTTFDAANAANWPDTPFDLYCKDVNTNCTDRYSPSFWTRKRLRSITTQVLTGGAYADVDTWALDQDFPASGDGISRPMWLKEIQRFGKSNTASTSLPKITFAGQQKPNRVDRTGDGFAPFIRLRMYQITTETGGTIGIDYHDPDCTVTSLPPTDATNATRCFHAKSYEGEVAKDDYFNTYPVKRVTEGDNILATPDVVTEYAYVGGTKWVKSEDEFTKAADRTYSVPRGYYLVQTRKGAATDAKTLSESRYFRGIDGDLVKDSAGVNATDRVQFAGMLRDQAVYNGDGGALVSATSYRPWRSAVTATRTRSGLSALEAYMTNVELEETRTETGVGRRTTQVERTFDSYGMVSTITEHGDMAKTGDETCTRPTYVRNTATWMLDKVSRSETVAVACTVTPSRPDDVIDDVRTYYDNGALGAAPVKGLVTKTERINGAGTGYETASSTPSTCGATGDQLCYDAYGRQTAAADAYGKVTRTSFTPATAAEPAGGVPTTTTVTNPLGHTVTTVLDPRRSQPTKVTDPNGKITTNTYDLLGRITKTWLPNRSAVTYPTSPNYEFTYLVRTDGPIVTTTKTLTHDSKFQTSYVHRDGLLRDLQTQEESPDRAGMLVSEQRYNTRGEVTVNSGTYFATGTPSTNPVTGQETNYPSSTETLYDGAGRPTVVIAKRFNDETKRTTTTYTGDTTTVIPPAGSVATTTVVDALNRTTELKQYTDAARTTSQSTLYSYDTHGRLVEVTDPANAKWTYKYDVRGRQIETTDPDKGKSTTVYDKGGRATDVTDAREITLHTDYDELGRTKTLKKGTATLAAWTYDTIAKGQLSTATRYDGANAYTTETTAYNSLYLPLTTKVTIPPSEGKLAGTYQWGTNYNTITGHVEDVEHPEIADLPYEIVVNSYTPVTGLPDTMTAGDDPLVVDTTYDHYGQPTRVEYGEFGRQIWTTAEYDDHTGLPTRAFTDRDTAPQRIEDTKYTYDPSGNITQIAAAYGQDATRTTDTQCFQLDRLRRITEAWTNTGEACATDPSTTAVGGPDSYWTTYTYDAVGNRNTETQHKTPSGPTADTVRTYAPPAAGKHALPSVTQTGIAEPETYTYDAAGNTKTRKIGTADQQTFDWDDEGHLKSVTKAADTTSYLYDTAGQRLIRSDSTGKTLYLPGGNELHLDKAETTVTGTRYYGKTAMRTGGKLTFLLTDHHGTGTTQITNDATQAVTRRKTSIFGAPRGTQPTNWVGDKGFVGGTNDTDTGLTHLGAREYDPAIGRFISVDPILDLKDPQQTHGYTYANNNPVAFSDPTGLRPDGICGGNSNRCVPSDSKSGESVTYHETWEPTGTGWKWKNRTEGSNGKSYYQTAGVGWGHVVYLKRRKLEISWNTLAGMGRSFFSTVDLATSPAALVGFTPATDMYDGLMDMIGVDTDSDAYEDGEGLANAAGLMFAGAGAAKGSAKGAAKATGMCHSFLPGTEVLMADGSRKSIEDVKVGDVVVTTDADTKKTYAKKVLETIQTEDDKDFTEISISTGDGLSSIVSTDTHPFWEPELKKWVKAGDLAVGQWLRTSAGTYVQITAVDHYTKRQRTHDLTIDDVHAYYVLADETPVLVHNCSGIVYRNLRPDENPANGLVAKNPDATYTPAGHVLHGSKPNWKSQYISTTRSRTVALDSQWSGPRVVQIDLSKLHPSQVFDLSDDAGRLRNMIRGFTAINRTKSSQEVLITGIIPREAITWVRGGP